MTNQKIEQLRQKLNEIYVEREEQINLIINAFNNKENIWLYGLTGTAKSALFNDMAKGLGYSIYHINQQSAYFLLESYDEINRTYNFNLDTNIPTVLFLNHPYFWHKSPDSIKAIVDIQRRRPELFPFEFIVGESLWPVNHEKTNWLTDYFQQEIQFEDIKNPLNRKKALKTKSLRDKYFNATETT
ncbi:MULTISPECIES: hypothetical protein [Calothrix]|uniref:MoxR domain-containing protein n=2 Tax=Calothrix TaxID=1186 RepID=A0ABR8A6M6_9CYAN|nr:MULTISPECIES: hypothetical protein [Calothrix]MBD2195657.1 hypothetical protein [Calothrix parietina FACHB-288]MBD2224312.1 hypothetical protein [Calothrix anomala FACHB-343]